MTAIQQERDRRRIERERVETERDADAIRARCRTLAGFIKEAWHVLEPQTPYVHNWHIDLICAHLEAVTYGYLLDLGRWNRLQFNVPPGCMKSKIVSVFWNAWEWGPAGMPGLRYLSTSYNEEWVVRDTRDTRNLIESDWYQTLWGDKVRLVRRGETSFATDKHGWRHGVPFSSLTSGRAHRVLIDDPHSVKTAEFETQRAETIRIFRTAAQNRLVDAIRSAIVLIMQRLHPSDCSGVQEELNLGYLKVSLPMELETKTDKTSGEIVLDRFVSPLPLNPKAKRNGKSNGHATNGQGVHSTTNGSTNGPGSRGDYGNVGKVTPAESPAPSYGEVKVWADPRTREGELLDPVRFPPAVVERMKRELGERDAAGQLQQRPSPKGGLMFKRHWFKFIGAAPAGTRWCRGWDLAATERKTKDTTTGPAWTAGVKLGRGPDDGSGSRYYVGGVVRLREEGLAVEKAIVNTADEDGPRCEQDLPQDPGQAGKTQAQNYIAKLAGKLAFASPETGDKETRAQPVSVQAEAGNIYIVATADPVTGLYPAWVKILLDELETFPASKFKDQVDALSRAFARLTRRPHVPMVGAVVVSSGSRMIPGQ